ncbi:hypothetical protein AcW1_002895 [Taiwanofungus camphoratus]|nr:hypothetical protein AcW1_002895 [Antrodia cinnamomea]
MYPLEHSGPSSSRPRLPAAHSWGRATLPSERAVWRERNQCIVTFMTSTIAYVRSLAMAFGSSPNPWEAKDVFTVFPHQIRRPIGPSLLVHRDMAPQGLGDPNRSTLGAEYRDIVEEHSRAWGQDSASESILT